MAGDFTAEPREDSFVYTLANHGVTMSYPTCPTPWGGKRCVDYFATNAQINNVQALDFEVGDHLVVHADMNCSVECVSEWKPLPCLREVHADMSWMHGVKMLRKLGKASCCLILLMAMVWKHIDWEILSKPYWQTLVDTYRKPIKT